MRRYRRGMMVDKSISSKCRTQLWYLGLVVFLLWLFLFYLYNSSVLIPSHEDTMVGENLKSTIHESQSDDDSVDGNGIVNETVGSLSLKGIDNNRNSSANNQETDEDESEDAKLVKDLVLELDMEASIDEKRVDDSTDKVEKSNNKLISVKEQVYETATRNFSNNDATKGSKIGSDKQGRVSGKRNRKMGGKQKKSFNSSSTDDNKRIENVDLKKTTEEISKGVVSEHDPCKGRYIYIHELPSLFNDDLLKNCLSLSWWTDMCELTANLGLGPHLPDFERVSGWFATNQFTSEIIIYNRMKQYQCLSKDSSIASAIFVPYFAGLDVARYLWGPYPSMRDAAALDLMKWLKEKPEWKRLSGRDHFMVAGRTTWDFMRTPGNDSDWGNRLMILPESRNMTVLLIESSPWNYNGVAIPYPTYFHPSKDDDVFQWQNKMRREKRRYLFSFVGGPRPNLRASIRGEVMNQCRAAGKKCKLLECLSGSNKCYKPDQIMKFFQSSIFCLQPPGDSYTRRSTFDSILAGCIPVFFHPGSAYAQYIWHLPKNYPKYSVFIPANEVKDGKASIERILSQIPRAKVILMREEVVKLIPKVIYADPEFKLESLEDAFDITVKGVLGRIEGIRNKVKEGKNPIDFPEEYSWKYNLFGKVEKHEWDPYFDTLRNV